uniref:Ribonuclease H protein At1g65750 family n=1 Tax=Cajanus cajan TaxID=3821 RepID=A0A151T5E6_CAJCA|nr:Putative ribonuclease H protein At1g65750 family [Cajanus cajan]
MTTSCLATCGGVLRDYLGNFIFAYLGVVRACSVLQAKFWAIFHGIRLIKEHGIEADLIIESDLAVVVKFFNDGCSQDNPCYSLVNHIVRMAGDIHNLVCVHILRKANQVVDDLAKFGLSLSNGIVCFDSLPS